jgi:hypothetical protein
VRNWRAAGGRVYDAATRTEEALRMDLVHAAFEPSWSGAVLLKPSETGLRNR